jgi:hypothetical protein
MSMWAAYQKTPPAGEAFNPGLTPGVFSLDLDKFNKCGASPLGELARVKKTLTAH